MSTAKSSYRDIEYRKVVAQEYYSGKNIEQIMQQYKVPRSTLYRWLKKYREPDFPKGQVGEERIRELLDTISALEKENQLLRRAISIIAK